MGKEVITDIETLSRLIESKNGNKWQKLLISVLLANIVTVVTGLGYAVKNYFVFQNTVAEVQILKIVQENQGSAIQDIRIKDATQDAKIQNLERIK